MEGIAILIVLGLIVLVFVLPIAAMVRSGNAKHLAESFDERLRDVQARARAMARRVAASRRASGAQSARVGPAT